jgi:Bacterial Ig-like domain (group 1)
MRFSKHILGFLATIALVACGGGGGSSGASPNTAVTPGAGSAALAPASAASVPVTAGSVVADFIFELDKTSVLNTGADKAILTVLVLDKNRNVVSGIPVTVAVDSGGVFAATGSTTDASGKLAGSITIGGDKANRTINATITVNGIVKVASVVVTGSQIVVTPVPATPSPGQQVTLNISTSDSAGAPIQNTAVTLGGSAGASGALTTDVAGIKTATFTAPSTAGTYTVLVTGLGVSTTKNIQVVVAGGAGIPAAIGPISSASLSPQPTSISANAVGATTSRSKLSAKFLTTGNSGLENMRVRFEIVPPALGAGEVISTGDAVVYSDVGGVAEADYIAGTRSSPTNGVSVRACYKATDFSSATDCPSQVTATLTVAGTPLSISISDDNKMSKGLGGIAYVKQFLIQVNDAAGVAVKDSIITASVDITHYGKGLWNRTYPLRSVAPSIANPSLAAALDGATGLAFKAIPSSTTAPGFLAGYTPATTYFNVWCINEDKNRNGSLDSLEDTNGDGVLQPRKAEIIVSYVSGNKTDVNGQMLIQISHGQNVGGWLAYTLRATTGVAGSEGDASKSYITNVLEEDVINGSFLTPPFGSNACNVVN